MLPWEMYVHSDEYNAATEAAKGRITQTSQTAFTLAAGDGTVFRMRKISDELFVITDALGPSYVDGGIERAKCKFALEAVFHDWKVASKPAGP